MVKSAKTKNKVFDYDFYINRNKEVAIANYGNLLTAERTVRGTDIWFDEYWRVHKGTVIKTKKNKRRVYHVVQI